MADINNDDLGALLGDAVMGNPAPAATPDASMVNPDVPATPSATDGQVTAEPAPQVPSTPQFDPSVLEGQMNQQAQQMQQMAQDMERITSRVPEPVAPQPSEQDMLQAQVKKDLGIDKMEERYAQQDTQMKAQQEQLQAMQQQETVRQRDAEFKSMEADFGNIDKLAIQNKIVEIGKTNPALAEALNSPDGVRMLLGQGVGTVTATPDPITPSASGTDTDASSLYGKLSDGSATDADFGDMLFDAMS